MDWIFDNIVIIAIIGSAIAQWLKSRSEDGEEEAPQDRPGRKKIDVEQLERNRRLREEIRRKREERQRGEGPLVEQPAPKTIEDLEKDIAPQLPPVLREMMGIPDEPVRAPQPPPVPDSNPVLDRQQRMQEEMAALEEKKREAQAMAKKAGVGALQQARRRRAARPEEMSERDFLATLRNPRQARRAVVLREVLGKPLALR
ncbi:MAG: hypothetical protein SynsKO_39970 [Synoicihabitans sp.]